MTTPSKQEQESVLSLIQDIKDKRVDPRNIDKDMRQLCVEMFMAEGYSKAQMAEILKRSDKTIKRDIDEVFLRNSVNPDQKFVELMAGRLLMAAEIHRNHLMRLARSKGSSVMERAQAEYLAFKVWPETVSKLQSLGYLPSQPQAVVGDISLNIHQEGEKSFEELRAEVIEIEKNSIESGEISEEMKKELRLLTQQIEKAEIADKLHQIQSKTTEAEDEKEDS